MSQNTPDMPFKVWLREVRLLGGDVQTDDAENMRRWRRQWLSLRTVTQAISYEERRAANEE